MKKNQDIKVSIITSCFQGGKFLSGYFDNVINQSYFQNLEIVFIHNQPTLEELQIIKNFVNSYPEKIRYIKVESLENISASWNRGWLNAKGKHLTIWNVDDQRPTYSIELLSKSLDRHPGCDLSYGDYVIVPEYGHTTGNLVTTPEFSKKYFGRSFPLAGAFFMWRAELKNAAGMFDEQLQIGMDYDFSLRLTHRGTAMCRVDWPVGYFTDSGEGVSTRSRKRDTIDETNFLYYRYGAYDKIRYQYWNKIKSLDWQSIYVEGVPVTINKYIENIEKIRNSRRYLWALYFVRNFLRYLLEKAGLLPHLYRFQQKYIKRDF